jgi:ferredoxin
MRVAIVGTGLSAWATFEFLKMNKRDGVSITIIDANNRYSTGNSVHTVKGLKNKFESSFAYEVSGGGIMIREQTNFSLAHGGLSNTWGAGIRLWDEEHLEFASIQTQEIYKTAEILLRKIPFSGDITSLNFPSNLKLVHTEVPRGSHSFDALFEGKKNPKNCQISRTALAVCVSGPNACRGCGQCLSGCPYGSIFETSSLFDESLSKEEFVFIEGIVRSIKKNKSGATLFYETKNHTIESLEFDKVYLCAGAIGTPSILMRSNLLPNHIKVADSQVFYFIGFSYFQKNKRNEYFGLSQATLSSDMKRDYEFMCSLYSCNSDVRKRISDLIASKLFGLRIKLPKFLDRILFFGIGFIDSSQSGTIQLDFIQDTGQIEISSIRNPNSKKNVKMALRAIAKNIRKSKMFVSPWFYQMPNPGAGFHSGASMPAGGTFVSENGTLRSLESVVIADVSILPFIKPGPHTFTSMAINAALIQASQN